MSSVWEDSWDEPAVDLEVAGRAFEAAADHQRAVREEAAKLRARRDARAEVAAEESAELVLPPMVRLDEFLARPLDPITHRIAGLWPVGGRVMLAAQFKAGKTTLRDNAIRALVDDEPFLGQHEIAPLTGPVVLLDFELDEQTLQRWLGDQQFAHPERVHATSMKGRASSFNILDESLRSRWAEHLAAVQPAVLVLDCLRPILDALGLSEDKEAGRFLVAFDELVAQCGAREALVVHHMGHGSERSRGDSRLRDWPDAEWRLVRDKEGDDPTLDDVHGARYFSAYGRDVDVKQVELTFDASTRHLTVEATATSRKQAGERRKLDSSIKAVLAAVEASPGIHKRGLRDACRALGARHNPSIDEAVDLLRSEGRIRVTAVGQTHLHYLSTLTVSAVPNRAHDTADTTVSRALIGGTPRSTPTEADQSERVTGHGPVVADDVRDRYTAMGAEQMRKYVKDAS